mgnify:CR=1 FL=1
MFNAIFRFFMKITGVDRKILINPIIQKELNEISEISKSFNSKMDELEKLIGHDYSDIKLKHNKKNEKNNS